MKVPKFNFSKFIIFPVYFVYSPRCHRDCFLFLFTCSVTCPLSHFTAYSHAPTHTLSAKHTHARRAAVNVVCCWLLLIFLLFLLLFGILPTKGGHAKGGNYTKNVTNLRPRISRVSNVFCDRTLGP